ncbi:type VI secretion system baseplate subunit TssE [Pseudomonas sp. KFB-139]|uniref:Type VI secretion system baseplate subunit TssE n=1 Tax=Pseudomonas serbiensis TaxID=3064350 RepID=A0ABT9CNE2_9PSED|nr:type VI secretion system baseplate subunit TssE [Pseudomonas sp. KFB-138]MDO7927015.1 type VI secretion system baseplate subunit TssE [Pseudomonas sp. KFB-138]
MSPYGSLFERLGGESRGRNGMSREECVIASVAAHLAKMLSTRAGSVQTLPDYGLPDLNDMSMSLHDILVSSRSTIEAFIRMCEPRLYDVSIAPLPPGDDKLRLRFSIEGFLVLDGIKRAVSFAASLDGCGKVNIN